MTTIMGIKAYDPNKERAYLLFAADSQGTTFNKKQEILSKQNNAQKIWNPKSGNYLIAHCGTYIHPKHSNLSPRTAKAYKQILESNNTPEELEKNLEKMSRQYPNSYIVGIDDNKKLRLQEYSKDMLKILNNLPIKCNFYADSLICCFKGSGEKYARKYISLKINSKKEVINGEELFIVSIDELLFNCLNGLKEAARWDYFTGGHMDFATLTSDRCIRYLNFANLKKDEEFSRLKGKAEEKLKKYKSISENSLEDILFGY